MTDPENHTLHPLRELRASMEALDTKLDRKVDALDNKIDRNHEELKGRFDRLQKAMVGESVLGRYATAEIEERLSAINGHSSALEQRR